MKPGSAPPLVDSTMLTSYLGLQLKLNIHAVLEAFTKIHKSPGKVRGGGNQLRHEYAVDVSYSPAPLGPFVNTPSI